MAQDVRLRVTPLQMIGLLLFLPPFALFILLKTCLLRLLLGKQKIAPQTSKAPSRWDVVCLSHVHWLHIWQRNHHTMVHLARRSKVLYVNPIRLDAYIKHNLGRILGCRQTRRNLWHCECFVLPFETKWAFVQRINLFLVETRIRRWMKRFGLGPDIVLWFYFPSQRYLTGRLGERAVVYDIQDEYSQFPWAPRDTAEKERYLLAEADVVFAGTDALYERKRPLARNIHFFGCGVDWDHFHNLYHRDVPHDLAHLRGGVTLGYFGSIDERVDRDLLAHVIRERPNWNLVMIGPVSAALFKVIEAPNVVFTGSRAYELLPRYLARFDVCLMPFAINEMTRHINPTKALEYFASGRPVVSRPIPDMVKYYSDVIYFASTPQEFVEQCELALRNFPPERRERGLQLARERSWERVVSDMRRLIDEAIATVGTPAGRRCL